jgi:hypothetical protein
MTDKEYSPHETWCDTQNKISDWCNCMASTYIEEIDSLKLALKEIDEVLRVPAAEYVPAIGDAFKIIDRVLHR